LSEKVIYRCTVNGKVIETRSREEHLKNIQYYADKGCLVSSNIVKE